jgi:hypothetical protein
MLTKSSLLEMRITSHTEQVLHSRHGYIWLLFPHVEDAQRLAFP